MSAATSLAVYTTANIAVWILSGYSIAVPALLQQWHGLATTILIIAMFLGAAMQAEAIRNVRLIGVLAVGGILPIVAWIAFDVIGMYKKEYYLILVPVALVTLLVALIGGRRLPRNVRRAECQRNAIRILIGIAFGGVVSLLLYQLSDRSEFLIVMKRYWMVGTGGSLLALAVLCLFRTSRSSHDAQ